MLSLPPSTAEANVMCGGAHLVRRLSLFCAATYLKVQTLSGFTAASEHKLYYFMSAMEVPHSASKLLRAAVVACSACSYLSVLAAATAA